MPTLTGSSAVALTLSGRLNLTLFTASERAIVQGSHTDHYVKFEITDPDDQWVDVSSDLDVVDWLNSVSISDSVDQNTMSMGASLLRNDTPSGLSLAPLMEGSTINRDGVALYAPMLDVARMWRCSVAVVAHGNSPTGLYKEIGKGYIDTVSVNDAEPTIDVVGRGEEAPIIDHFVTAEVEYATTGVAEPVEDVLQDMLDDELGLTAPTIYVPTPMNYTVQNMLLEEGSLMGTLAKIAGMAGAVIRYRYDESGVNRLTLYKPEREAEAGQEDWEIGSTEYLRIPINKIDISGVRNNIIVRFEGPESPVTVSDSTSIARYGTRSLIIDLSAESQITDAATATIFAEAILSDLEVPALEQQIETFGFWFVRLQDYAKLTANNVHYDTAQYGGVTGFTHQIENGHIRTSISMGGQPRGGYRRWLPWGQRLDPVKPPFDPDIPPIFKPGVGTLICWIDASQETSYDNNDDVNVATDFSGRGNHASNSQSTAFQPVFKESITAVGGPVFEFTASNNGNFGGDADTDANSGEPEYLRTPILGTPTDGMTIYFVGRRNGSHIEHTNFYRLASTTDATNSLKEATTPDTEFTFLFGSISQIAGSLSTSFFIHCLRVEGASLARQYVNGVDKGYFNPPATMDTDMCVILAGGGNIQIAEMRVYEGSQSQAVINSIMAQLSDKHGI